MALRSPLDLRRRIRRRAVIGLRWLADQLRDDLPLTTDPVVVQEVTAESGVAAASQEASHADVMASSIDTSRSEARQGTPEPAGLPSQRRGTQPLSEDPTSSGPSDDPAPVAEQGESGPEEANSETYHAIIDALQTIYDPEIPVDIYELGLIYSVDLGDNGHVDVEMTLTTPNCPAAQSLPEEVRSKVTSVDDVVSTEVRVVFDPPWSPEMMSEEARLMLNV